jgi:hypothetical protein
LDDAVAFAFDCACTVALKLDAPPDAGLVLTEFFKGLGGNAEDYG